LLRESVELGLDHAPDPPLAGENPLDLRGQLLLLGQLVADLLDLHLGDLVELGVEDRVGLDVAELEDADEFFVRIRAPLTLADQLDRLVEGVEDDLETFEDMDPLLELSELVLEPLGDDLEPEIEERLQDLLEAEPGRLRLAVRVGSQAGEVVSEVVLQARV